jgi:hypothetical protein
MGEATEGESLMLILGSLHEGHAVQREFEYQLNICSKD